MRALVLLAAVAFAAAAVGGEPNFAPPAVLDLIRASGIPPHRIGVVIRPADGGRPPNGRQSPNGGDALASVNARRSFNPASVIKVVTAYAALDLLGPDFRWKTTIARGGKIGGDGVLRGDLHLIGGGDPFITVERFWGMVRELRARGIREIVGALVIDDTLFRLPPHDPGAFDGAGLRPYNVGAGAMAVNFKASEVILAPAANGGVSARISPPSDAVRLENRLRLDGKRCGNYRGRVRERWRQADGKPLTLALSGAYSRRCGARGWRLAAPLGHPAYVAGVFAAMWRESGGVFGGAWRVGKAPAAAKTVAVFESPPLAELLRGMNKYSNNFMARQIFLSLPSSPPPYDLAAARAAVGDWLRARGILKINGANGEAANAAKAAFFIDNGSGLSRRARMTPALMAAALASAWNHPWRAELLSSLPLAGLDGTMKKRLRADKLAGQARFKTGSLHDVKALAGFVRDAEGRDWIVVCFINSPSGWKARRFQDNLLRWLFQNGAAASGV